MTSAIAKPSSVLAPLRTTVVGSYPQPDWLVDRAMLGGRVPPRVRAREIWRVPERFLEQAQDDATLIAIRDMERARIDIISDGEIRRESYSNRFATALDGIGMKYLPRETAFAKLRALVEGTKIVRRELGIAD